MIWTYTNAIMKAELDFAIHAAEAELDFAINAAACRKVSDINWQPVFAASCYWRVFRGQRQLGHVARRVGPGCLASYIEPSGRRLERPFATLREAAVFASTGTEVSK